MANYFLTLREDSRFLTKEEKADHFHFNASGTCQIFGHANTFKIVRRGNDLIISLGYICLLNASSQQETLEYILKSFDETKISEIKEKSIGQYVLLIKKDKKVFLFSDFMGSRNIFYSEEHGISSSSFSLMENFLGTELTDLDVNKVFEFIFVKHVLYPGLLGSSTFHKKIKWLMPYEYIVIDENDSSFRVKSIKYYIENDKKNDSSVLSDELLATIRNVVRRPEFKDSMVTATLSGGRDSRVVAAAASEYYPNICCRIAVDLKNYDALKDMKVAQKITKLQGIDQKVYKFNADEHKREFIELTEGLSPTFNNKMTPLIRDSGTFALGFGGVYGTELFMPIPWNSIEEFVNAKIRNAARLIFVSDAFWKFIRDLMYEEFNRIKDHYRLSKSNDRDYIRIFLLINTARYGSFILTAFNHYGYELEPYGCQPMLKLALQIPPEFWGNHRSLRGDATIQKIAMEKLNLRMAKVLTYKNYRPMVPLSWVYAPRYIVGVFLQALDVLRRIIIKKGKHDKVELPGGSFYSEEWEEYFLDRISTKYGLNIIKSYRK